MLENPARDAMTLRASLERHGFSVTIAADLEFAEMNAALREFRYKADKAEIAMIYYAGHGIEIGGQNYLIPVDARLQDERDAPVEAITADAVLRQISGAGQLRILVLDACRDNPFAAQMKRANQGRSVGRGLARVEVNLQDTLIAYAAAAGEITPDGKPGSNSPFTAAFIEALNGPQRDVRRLFGAVRDNMRKTVPEAEPFVYTSLGGREYFIQNVVIPKYSSKPIGVPDPSSPEIVFLEFNPRKQKRRGL